MDIFVLLKLNIDIKNIVFDTMIGSYLLNPASSNYGIDELAKEHLNIYIVSEEELLGKGKNKKIFSGFRFRNSSRIHLYYLRYSE